MPKVLTFYTYSIYINGREHNPVHCHVRGPGGREARFNLVDMCWMDEVLFSVKDTKAIEAYIVFWKSELLNAWSEYNE